METKEGKDVLRNEERMHSGEKGEAEKAKREFVFAYFNTPTKRSSVFSFTLSPAAVRTRLLRGLRPQMSPYLNF